MQVTTEGPTFSQILLPYLEYNFFWGLIGLQEVADVDKCPLFTGAIFTFEMIPAKFDKLFSMMDKVILEILEKQSCKLQKFYSQRFIILGRYLQRRYRNKFSENKHIFVTCKSTEWRKKKKQSVEYQAYKTEKAREKITSSGGSRSLSTIVLIIVGSTTSQLWPFWKE